MSHAVPYIPGGVNAAWVWEHVACPSLGWDLAAGTGQLVWVGKFPRPFMMLLVLLLALRYYIALNFYY